MRVKRYILKTAFQNYMNTIELVSNTACHNILIKVPNSVNFYLPMLLSSYLSTYPCIYRSTYLSLHRYLYLSHAIFAFFKKTHIVTSQIAANYCCQLISSAAGSAQALAAPSPAPSNAHRMRYNYKVPLFTIQMQIHCTRN